MAEAQQVLIKVTGRVQGVFFRATAKDIAEQNGICGYAKNAPDGSVEMKAQGNAESIENFIAWAKKGPAGARVDSVEVSKQRVQENLVGFLTL